MASSSKTRVLIVEGRFYEDISDELVHGAVDVLEDSGVAYERIDVPGALEIPIVIAMAHEAGRLGPSSAGTEFAGCVALGCVIRGETSHYDIVAGQSARALMDLATTRHLPIGNGILTVDNREQAMVRARGGRAGKGGDAASACLRLMEIWSEIHGRQVS